LKFDRNTILAVSLCIIFYLFYNQYLTEKYPHLKNQEAAQQTAPADENSSVPVPAPDETASGESGIADTGKQSSEAALIAPIVTLSIDDLTIENDKMIYQFDQARSALAKIVLKDYQRTHGPDSEPIDIVDQLLVIQGGVSLDDSLLGKQGFSGEREGNSITFSRDDREWTVSQTFKIPEQGYGADIVVTWKNQSEIAQNLMSTVMMRDAMELFRVGGFLPGMPTALPTLTYSSSQDSDYEDARSFCESTDGDVLVTLNHTKINYIGLDKHYFIKALLPQTNNASFNIAKDRSVGDKESHCTITFKIWQQHGLVNPGDEVTLAFKAWFGPKDDTLMKTFDASLEESMHWGFFGFISYPLLAATRWIYGIVGNYGIAIILLTLVLKILFYPLTKQATISMQRMKKLQPEMNKIREKYKDDRQAQQRELMGFMSKNKVNPMKGCLPILPQIPVFFAFYRVLSTSIELRHAPFFGWITDLSSADPYYITPIILGACMFIQQRLTPTTGLDKMQERMMMMIPLVFSIFMLTLPAGMVLYMLTNTVLSIAQQYWLNRKYA
jgi:YidC/Oxa1 family membrane protein insertase